MTCRVELASGAKDADIPSHIAETVEPRVDYGRGSRLFDFC
jgi:hypothetical protein